METAKKVPRSEKIAWFVVFALIVVVAVPWFMWGVDATVYGVPIWIWWHIAWMVVASLTFGVFTRRAWGVAVEDV